MPGCFIGVLVCSRVWAHVARKLDKAAHELQKMTFGVLDRCAPPSTDPWRFSWQFDRYPLITVFLLISLFFSFDYS